jgi:uncharacterized protein
MDQPLKMDKLIIFVKAPRPGLVKTRLAQALGPEAAARIYQQLVAMLLKSLGGFENVELRFAPDDALPEIRSWLRPGWTALPQGKGDLGMRLTRALAEAFESGSGRVVVIGSDSPEVTAMDIQEAWAGLHTHELVLGPACDGGYWLIGLNRPLSDLFDRISWSTARVLEQTEARARAAGMSWMRLRELADIDTAEDWEKFCRSTPVQEPMN